MSNPIHPESPFGAQYEPVVADLLVAERKGLRLSAASTAARDRLQKSENPYVRACAAGVAGIGKRHDK